jgi:4-oxalocrotonate tautomerase family enzyme
MPYVNIKVTREGTPPGASSTTPEQKAALIKGVSDLLFEVLGKPHNATGRLKLERQAQAPTYGDDILACGSLRNL